MNWIIPWESLIITERHLKRYRQNNDSLIATNMVDSTSLLEETKLKNKFGDKTCGDLELGLSDSKQCESMVVASPEKPNRKISFSNFINSTMSGNVGNSGGSNPNNFSSEKRKRKISGIFNRFNQDNSALPSSSIFQDVNENSLDQSQARRNQYRLTRRNRNNEDNSLIGQTNQDVMMGENSVGGDMTYFKNPSFDYTFVTSGKQSKKKKKKPINEIEVWFVYILALYNTIVFKN